MAVTDDGVIVAAYTSAVGTNLDFGRWRAAATRSSIECCVNPQRTQR